MRNQQLLSIKKNDTNGKYILTFQPTETTEGVTKPFSEGHYLVNTALLYSLSALISTTLCLYSVFCSNRRLCVHVSVGPYLFRAVVCLEFNTITQLM